MEAELTKKARMMAEVLLRLRGVPQHQMYIYPCMCGGANSPIHSNEKGPILVKRSTTVPEWIILQPCMNHLETYKKVGWEEL